MNSTENQQYKQQQNEQEMKLPKANLLEIAQQKPSKNNETIQNQSAKKSKTNDDKPKNN